MQFRKLQPALIAWVSVALGAQSVPTSLNYQGRLTDNSGAQSPVTATVPMAFSIWDEAGVKLWQEPASGGISVPVTNGIFSVALGSSVPLPLGVFAGSSSERHLEIILNPGPAQEVLAPRQRIATAAYAQLAQKSLTAESAATATNATNAAQLGGVAASGWQPNTNRDCGAGSYLQAVLGGGGTTCASLPPASLPAPPWILNGNSANSLFDVTNSGTGVAAQFTSLSSANTVIVQNNGVGTGLTATGNNVGLRGVGTNNGVIGTTSTGVGVYGLGVGVGSYGMYATNTNGMGLYAASVNGLGINAISTNSDAIRARTDKDGGMAVYGQATTGSGVGVWGNSAAGIGVYGQGAAKGVYGASSGGNGVEGYSGSLYGVFGQSDGHAVRGQHTSSGNWGYIGGGAVGVYGQGNPYGVRGFSTAGVGVTGSSTAGVGVDATSSSGHGLTASSATADGVHATSGSGFGVFGESDGQGVRGLHTSSGNWGYLAGGAVGVYGQGNPYGVRGFSAAGTGVTGSSTSGVGIDATSSTGSAATFSTDASTATAAAVTVSNNGAGAGVRIDQNNGAGVTYGLSAGVASPDGFGLHTEDGARVEGLTREGIETGTSQAPALGVTGGYRGLVTRRVSSTVHTTGSIVARTDILQLERDGTVAGLRLNAPVALSARTGVYCTGLTAAGAALNKVLELNSGFSGVTALYASGDNMVRVDCSFGNSYNNGHVTRVELIRWSSDNFFNGTLTSTYNQ